METTPRTLAKRLDEGWKQTWVLPGGGGRTEQPFRCSNSRTFGLHPLAAGASRSPAPLLAALACVAHLQDAFLGARVQLEVMDADGRHDVAFPPGVAGAVGEGHLVVAVARPQQTQVLTGDNRQGAPFSELARRNRARFGAAPPLLAASWNARRHLLFMQQRLKHSGPFSFASTRGNGGERSAW